MSSFTPKLQDSSDDRLRYLIDESNPQYAALASDELTRREMEKLKNSIDGLNSSSLYYSRIIAALTLILLGLGLIQVNIMVAQVGVVTKLYLNIALIPIFIGFYLIIEQFFLKLLGKVIKNKLKNKL